jgi:transposase
MPRCLTVAPHLSVAELEHRYRTCRQGVERGHWQIVWLVAGGHHCPAVATLTGYSEDWVRTIIHRYNVAGPEGLADQRAAHRGGNPALLTPVLRDELATALDGPAPDGGVWTCRKVATWLAARLDRPVADARGWEALRALGFTLQRPRPRSTQADPAAQAAFKKGGFRRRWMRSGPPTRRPS